MSPEPSTPVSKNRGSPNRGSPIRASPNMQRSMKSSMTATIKKLERNNASPLTKNSPPGISSMQPFNEKSNAGVYSTLPTANSRFYQNLESQLTINDIAADYRTFIFDENEKIDSNIK